MPDGVCAHQIRAVDPCAVVSHMAGGGTMVWIGPPDHLPAELWVGAFELSDDPIGLRSALDAPLQSSHPSEWQTAHAWSAYLKPPKELYYHNLDEEIRADLMPLVEAVDRFGQVIGYPSVLLTHRAPSLAGHRFSGAECFVFLFDDPLSALSAAGWSGLVADIDRRMRAGVRITAVSTDYAVYHPGERLRIRTQLYNCTETAASVTVRLAVQPPDSTQWAPWGQCRRCPDGYDGSEALFDLPVPTVVGLWRVRVESVQHDRACELSVDRPGVPIDCRTAAFIVCDDPLRTPALSQIDGTELVMDGARGFHAGTHYYPSSSWWEWLWRDFRVEQAARDLHGIRQTGYRFIRTWVDTRLTEQTLRAMDACIWLAAQAGLVVDVCVFSQWVNEMEYTGGDGRPVCWRFREPADGNIYSISFRRLEHQRAFIAQLAARWRHAGNVWINLANEVYVRDPDRDQMDAEAALWPETSLPNGAERDSLLVRRWIQEMTAAVRSTGNNAPILGGYCFSTLNGGDTAVANRDSEIVPWHSYMPECTAAMVVRHDPAASSRPIILQEFGALGWNATEAYEQHVYQALGAGAAAAMCYEWGVSWMAPEMCYEPLPLREAHGLTSDPRWFEPYVEISRTWPARGVGICATPSGFPYGSIYHGTPFPAGAARVPGRLAYMGDGLQRVSQVETVAVMAPYADTASWREFCTLLDTLWTDGVLVTVWPEEQLRSLPSAVRAVACAVPPERPDTRWELERLRHRGVRVCIGARDAHEQLLECRSVQVTCEVSVRTMCRHTPAGRLLVCSADVHHPAAVHLITPEGVQVTAALDGWLMLLDGPRGIGLVEFAGDCTFDGRMVFRASEGRIIIRSPGLEPLQDAPGVRLMATRPTLIEFARPIRQWRALLPYERVSEWDAPYTASTLRVTREMLPYPLEVWYDI